MYLILSLCQKKAGHVSALLPGEHAQSGTITLVLSQVFTLHIDTNWCDHTRRRKPFKQCPRVGQFPEGCHEHIGKKSGCSLIAMSYGFRRLGCLQKSSGSWSLHRLLVTPPMRDQHTYLGPGSAFREAAGNIAVSLYGSQIKVCPPKLHLKLMKNSYSPRLSCSVVR